MLFTNIIHGYDWYINIIDQCYRYIANVMKPFKKRHYYFVYIQNNHIHTLFTFVIHEYDW